jgi:hypothetical protein
MKTFIKVLANLILAAMYLVVVPLSYAAHVYVASATGVSVYTTSMTKIGFYTLPGSMIGSTGTRFITLEDNTLRAYAILANGGIGVETNSVDTALAGGGTCGISPVGAKIVGTDVYVLRNEGCGVVQTFTSALVFKGWADLGLGPDSGLVGTASLPDTASTFAYILTSPEQDICCWPTGLVVENGGSLVTINQNVFDTGLGYPQQIATVGTHLGTHLAAAMQLLPNEGTGLQLASYTIGSQGDLTSTNTPEDMPAVGWVTGMALSPSGTVLAVSVSTGVQFFHFNGAEPLTPFTGIIGSSGYITSMAWSGFELYAVNGASGKVHVYTVTTKVKEDLEDEPQGAVEALAVFVK